MQVAAQISTMLHHSKRSSQPIGEHASKVNQFSGRCDNELSWKPAARAPSALPSVIVVLVLITLSPATAQPVPTVKSGGNITALYVSVGGQDTSDCTNASSPCGTLKHAVEAVAAFMMPLDVPVPILLAGGDYTASNCGVLSSRPLNISGGGKHYTVINCEGTDRLLFTDSSLWMSSLTIVNGNSTGDGGGVAVSGNRTDAILVVALSDLAVVNCAGSSGGGVAIETIASSESVVVLLDEVDVVGCAAINGNGGGVYLSGPGGGLWNATLTDCTLFDNLAGQPASSEYDLGNGGIESSNQFLMCRFYPVYTYFTGGGLFFIKLKGQAARYRL